MRPTFKVSTSLGEISVGINNAKSIYFLNEKIVINGVDYHASGHMGLVNGKWIMLDTFSIRKVNSAKYGDYSRNALQKAHDELSAVISEWLGKGETVTLLNEANAEYINERREMLLSQIADKQKEMDELKAKLDALN